VGENIRSKAPRLAPILQGGGLALGYLSLYAMFFIPSVQMFHSHPAGWVCLVLYVAAAIGISLKSNSQTLAVLSMGFGYYTASYSGMESIALASTGILVFTTLAIALYRPEWGILKKASVLGAFATAGYWSDPVRPGSPMRPTGLSLLEFYTWGVFLLFHGAALWPRHKADAALNILNTVAFFWVYAGVLDHPMLESGLVMVMIATVHFASLGQMVTAFRDEIPSRWAWSSLMLGILFTGLATLDYSHGKVEAAVLAAEAFLLGFLSRQSSYPRTFRWSALVFWMVSGSILFFQGFTAKTGMVLTGAWVAAIGLALDYFVFCPQHRFMSLITLVFSSFGLFYSLCIELPPQWLTIGFVSTAFAYMTLGFLAKRRKHRRTALLWLLMAGLNLLFHDIESLSTPYKIGLFILLGVGLLLASYGYSLMEKHLAEESTKN
jgi:hypothetical protein